MRDVFLYYIYGYKFIESVNARQNAKSHISNFPYVVLFNDESDNLFVLRLSNVSCKSNENNNWLIKMAHNYNADILKPYCDAIHLRKQLVHGSVECLDIYNPAIATPIYNCFCPDKINIFRHVYCNTISIPTEVYKNIFNIILTSETQRSLVNVTSIDYFLEHYANFKSKLDIKNRIHCFYNEVIKDMYTLINICIPKSLRYTFIYTSDQLLSRIINDTCPFSTIVPNISSARLYMILKKYSLYTGAFLYKNLFEGITAIDTENKYSHNNNWIMKSKCHGIYYLLDTNGEVFFDKSILSKESYSSLDSLISVFEYIGKTITNDLIVFTLERKLFLNFLKQYPKGRNGPTIMLKYSIGPLPYHVKHVRKLMDNKLFFEFLALKTGSSIKKFHIGSIPANYRIIVYDFKNCGASIVLQHFHKPCIQEMFKDLVEYRRQQDDDVETKSYLHRILGNSKFYHPLLYNVTLNETVYLMFNLYNKIKQDKCLKILAINRDGFFIVAPPLMNNKDYDFGYTNYCLRKEYEFRGSQFEMCSVHRYIGYDILSNQWIVKGFTIKFQALMIIANLLLKNISNILSKTITLYTLINCNKALFSAENFYINCSNKKTNAFDFYFHGFDLNTYTNRVYIRKNYMNTQREPNDIWNCNFHMCKQNDTLSIIFTNLIDFKRYEYDIVRFSIQILDTILLNNSDYKNNRMEYLKHTVLLDSKNISTVLMIDIFKTTDRIAFPRIRLHACQLLI